MSRPAPERVRVSGPLASFADGFREHLVEQGYSLWSAQFQLLLVAHLSRWMEAERLEVGQLTPPVVERFLAERRRQGYVTRLSPVGVRPLLGYLDRLGVLSAGEDVRTPVDRLVAEFRRYLLEERALAVGSVGLYEPVARVFLEERSEPIDADLARLSGVEVNAFVLRESRRRGRASALTMVCALRSLSRFLHVCGLTAMSLATAVPSIPRRREDLPRGLPAGQVQSLLDSCDRATSVGCRDFAVLTLLARLGLRRGEVAGLELEDVDWRASEHDLWQPAIHLAPPIGLDCRKKVSGRVTLRDEGCVGVRAGGECSLEQSAEEQTTVACAAAVEAKGELVQVVVKLRMADRTLVGAKDPALKQRGHQMHVR
jgi:integrase/recombinase XerD